MLYVCTFCDHVHCKYVFTLSSNKNGETPIHCAAYNEVDSGALVELLMQTCTDDVKHQTLELRNADQVELIVLYHKEFALCTLVHTYNHVHIIQVVKCRRRNLVVACSNPIQSSSSGTHFTYCLALFSHKD